MSAKAQTNIMVDPRDGHVYKVVEIGTQTWMAENLRYTPTIVRSYDLINNNTPGIFCYNDDTANCRKYGALYSWKTAQKVCPVGWHLPSKEEYDVLLTTIGKGDAEKTYKTLIKGGSSGFEGLLGGYLDVKFIGLDLLGVFWTSTETSKSGAIPFSLSKYYDKAFTSCTPKKVAGVMKGYAQSIRCIKD